eukprot:1951008-Pyramimonas_sp.AAC.1
MGVSKTACGRVGSLTPPPTPSPGFGRGGAAGSSSAQDGPRLALAPEGPQRAQDGLQNGFQDTSRWFKIASDIHPRGLQTAPR